MDNLITYESIDYNSGQKISDYDIIKCEEKFLITKYNDLCGTASINTKNMKCFDIEKPRYEMIEKVDDNYYRAIFKEDDSEYGVIVILDKNGHRINDNYYYSFNREQNFYIVSNEDYYTIYDLDWNLIIKDVIEYNIYEDVIVYQKEKYGMIDHQGNKILNDQYLEIKRVDKDNYIINNNEKSLFNVVKREFTTSIYVKLSNLGDGYLKKEQLDDRIGVIDYQGNTILKSKYRFLEYLGNNHFLVSQDEKKAKIVDSDGRLVRKIKYNGLNLDLREFGGRFIVLERKSNLFVMHKILSSNKYLYDNEGHFIANDYMVIRDVIDDLVVVSKNYYRYYGLINTKGEKVIDQIYDEINYLEDGFYLLKIGNKRQFYDANNNYLGKDKYEYLKLVGDKLLYRKNSESGLMDKQEKMITKRYNDLRYLMGDIYCASMNNEWFLINSKDQQLSTTYLEITDCHDGYVKVTSNNGYGLININGDEVIEPIYPDFNYFEITDNYILFVHINNDNINSYSLFDKEGNNHFVNKVCGYPLDYNNQIIIDGYMFDPKKIKGKYSLKLFNDVEYDFNTKEERISFIKKYRQDFLNKLKQWYQERKQIIGKREKEDQESLLSLKEILKAINQDTIIDQLEENNQKAYQLLKENNQKAYQLLKENKFY